jgi:hypothetical protein
MLLTGYTGRTPNMRRRRNMSGIVGVLTGLLGLVGTAIGIIVAHHDALDALPHGVSSSPVVTSSAPATPVTTADVKMWAQKAAKVCTGIRPRFVSNAIQAQRLDQQANEGGSTPGQVAAILDQIGETMTDLSGYLAQISPPASILDRVTNAINQMDDGQNEMDDTANAERNGATVDQINTYLSAANANFDKALRTFGLLGATSCSDLI